MEKEDYNLFHHTHNFLFDFVAGSVAGAALTISGHPFDTLKVRMQFYRENTSMIQTIKSCFRNEGVGGFYKGMGFPLGTVPLVNAVVFSTNEMGKKLFGFHDENEMSLFEGISSGAFSGLVNCIVVTPVELVKCKLQVQADATKKRYNGIIDCLRKTYVEFGIKGLYKGNYATILREVPAYAGQFGSYFYAKYYLSRYLGVNQNELGNIHLMICGAIGGYFCWQFSYPQDVIKTRLQIDFESKYKVNKLLMDGGFYSCFQDIYRTDGLIGFWKGYTPCTIRAILANAVLFVVYENMKDAFTKYKYL